MPRSERSNSESDDEAPQEVSFSNTLKKEKELRKIAPVKKTIKKPKAVSKPAKTKVNPVPSISGLDEGVL